MERRKRAWMPANEVREDGNRRKNPFARDKGETRTRGEAQIFRSRTIPRMFLFGCRPDQSTSQQELDA
jgi:hypothetical protein